MHLWHISALPLDKDALSDPNDLPFAEVVVTGNADMLVTGNMKHFSRLKQRGMTVLSFTEFPEPFL
jgi:predicted nucleic acid-binding protein